MSLHDRRTKRHLGVEFLETRALLSALSVSLTTSQPVYQPGQPIPMTFTETNTSSQPVKVEVGPSRDGFFVTQNGTIVWQSNAETNPLYIVVDTLQPGQSLTLNATWNGEPNRGQTPILAGGTFTVTNQLDPQGASATFQIEPAVSVQNPQPVTATLTTNRPEFGAGQPVVITLTLKNTSNQSVAIAPNSLSDGFSVLSGSTNVWHSALKARRAAKAEVRTLSLGQSITFKTIWNGKPSSPGAKKLSAGSYTVLASEDGYSAGAMIQIG